MELNDSMLYGFVMAGLSAEELLRHEQEQEQARLNEARKISVVNVNPTNIRPHSDTPEIRKYKKRFNSEILCAALWGESRPTHTHTNTPSDTPYLQTGGGGVRLWREGGDIRCHET